MTATTEKKPTPQNSDNQRIEQWLEDNGVTEWEYRDKLLLTRIDRKNSRANQARPLNPIDEDWVVILAEAMTRSPKDIPPIVVKKQVGGRFKILDGNHRDEAAQLIDRTTLPAYVITQELTETQERMLAYTGNLRHGLSVDMDTRVRHALWLHEARGMTQSEAARAVGAPVERLHRRVQLERATRRVEAVDHKATRILGTGVRVRLDNIRSDVVHAEMTRLAVETKMSQQEVGPVVTAINKYRTEQDQLAVIENERKRRIGEIQATAGGKVPMPQILRNARASLSRIIRLDLEELRATEADPAVKKQIKAQATEAVERLTVLIDAL